VRNKLLTSSSSLIASCWVTLNTARAILSKTVELLMNVFRCLIKKLPELLSTCHHRQSRANPRFLSHQSRTTPQVSSVSCGTSTLLIS
jgi:hypothetical protein